MKRLFIMDFKDYDENWERSERPSVRAIIKRGEKLAMVHEMKHDYYMFPGGGIEDGESYEQALIREVQEETGLNIIPETIVEYGSVLRIQKSVIFEKTIFLQENFYYCCEAEDTIGEQQLDEHEKAEGYVLEFVTAKEALETNQFHDHKEETGSAWIAREAELLKMLMAESMKHY